MRYVNDRHIEFFLEMLHQIGYLRLHRHIQSRGRFVRNQYLGLINHGDGDHSPLALASRHLMGIGIIFLLRIRHSHGTQHFHA